MTPHPDRLDDTVRMRGRNIMVSVRDKKNYPSVILKYSLVSRALDTISNTHMS